MKFYVGFIEGGITVVTVDGISLDPRTDLCNYSRGMGFDWGYYDPCGGGVMQLALALLADCLGDDVDALIDAPSFSRKIVAHLDRDRPWILTEEDIRKHVTVSSSLPKKKEGTEHVC